MATKTERVSSMDLSRVNSMARRYIARKDTAALDEAAEYLELCLNEEEESRVKWWWNEGIRDYANSEGHIKKLNQLLLDRRAELYPA